MFRGDFLKALAGFGFVAAIPKEEDNPVITSEDGRTAWDSKGQVWSEAGDMYVEDYKGDRTYYPFPGARSRSL